MPQDLSGRRSLTKEDKIRLKKLQKKKELLGLYREKKITEEQFVKGMNKLGYSADVEKVLAFKKFIAEQIQAFEKMDVSGAKEGEYHFDPNESKAELPRDEFGNVITDFSVIPRPAAQAHISETYTQPRMVSARPPPSTTSARGPLFGDNLFDGERASRKNEPRKEIPKATLKRDVPLGPTRISNRRRRGMDLEWDEDEEEEEFEIDLEDPEHGWWDDEEWELDWSDEDEDEWEDWELDDEDEEEEDEWEMWEHRTDNKRTQGKLTIEFEDDEEEEDDEDVYDPVKYYWGGEGEEDDEEEEDDDWDDPPRSRRRRNY
ncbi:MAG: hypothetical protein ACMUHM_04540 [Thermoplasmatota archaeon]